MTRRPSFAEFAKYKCCCQLVYCLPLPVSTYMSLLFLICSGRKPTDNVSHESDRMNFSTLDQGICACNTSLQTSAKIDFESTVTSQSNDLRPAAATLGQIETLTDTRREHSCPVY